LKVKDFERFGGTCRFSKIWIFERFGGTYRLSKNLDLKDSEVLVGSKKCGFERCGASCISEMF
jgi:hypothetical protein